MIIGEYNRPQDLEINVCKTKQLTNMRSAGAEELDTLQAPVQMTLEQALEYIGPDEMLEVTPGQSVCANFPAEAGEVQTLMPEADPRFQQGLELFNAGEWYAAHDLFEELWHETADRSGAVCRGFFRWLLLNCICNGATDRPRFFSVKLWVV